MAAPPRKLPLKRYSVKTRFACNFLRALQSLNGDVAGGNPKNSTSSPAAAQAARYRRYRKIKLAAYASMASAVGTRRAWSRALLRRIRTRSALRRAPAANRPTKRSKYGRRPPLRRGRSRNDVRGGRDNAKELRKLVPGGDAMDFCCLLGETAHYIKCLTSQVEIMRNIADLFST